MPKVAPGSIAPGPGGIVGPAYGDGTGKAQVVRFVWTPIQDVAASVITAIQDVVADTMVEIQPVSANTWVPIQDLQT
jgi:hypothetical protein